MSLALLALGIMSQAEVLCSLLVRGSAPAAYECLTTFARLKLPPYLHCPTHLTYFAHLCSRCLNGLKRGGTMEATLCAQVLGLHMLSMPQPDEEVSLLSSRKPWSPEALQAGSLVSHGDWPRRQAASRSAMLQPGVPFISEVQRMRA